MHHLSCNQLWSRDRQIYIYFLFWSKMCNLHLIFIDGFHQLPPRIKVRALFKTRMPFLDGFGDIWRHLGLKLRESSGLWHRWWSFISSAALLRTAGETHWAPDAPVASPHTDTALMRVQPNYLRLRRKSFKLKVRIRVQELKDVREIRTVGKVTLEIM